MRKGGSALGGALDDAVPPGGIAVGLGDLVIPVDDKGVDAQLGGSDFLERIGGQLGVCLIVQVRPCKGGAFLYRVEVGGKLGDRITGAFTLGIQGGQVPGGGDDALAGVLVLPVPLEGLQGGRIALQIHIYLDHAFFIAGDIEDNGICRFPVCSHGAETVVGVFQLQLHRDAVRIAVTVHRGMGGQGIGGNFVAAGVVYIDVFHIGTGDKGNRLAVILAGIRLKGAIRTAFHRIEFQQFAEGGGSGILLQGVNDIGTAILIVRLLGRAIDDPHGGDFHIGNQRPCAAGGRAGCGGEGGRAHLVGFELIILDGDDGGITGLPVGEVNARDGRERLGGAVLKRDFACFQLDPLGVVGLAGGGSGHSIAGAVFVVVPAAENEAILDGGGQSARLKLGVRRKGAAVGNGSYRAS